MADATKEREDQDMDTIKDTSKPAATYVATNASTPGAVHVGVSLMEGQQATSQKTKGVADGGPTCYPKDDGKLTSGLKQESICSSKRTASRHFHNDKPFGNKPETTDAVGMTNEKLKKVGSRWQRQQENPMAPIVGQTAHEDT